MIRFLRNLTAEQQEYLDMVRTSAESLLGLLDEFDGPGTHFLVHSADAVFAIAFTADFVISTAQRGITDDYARRFMRGTITMIEDELFRQPRHDHGVQDYPHVAGTGNQPGNH